MVGFYRDRGRAAARVDRPRTDDGRRGSNSIVTASFLDNEKLHLLGQTMGGQFGICHLPTNLLSINGFPTSRREFPPHHREPGKLHNSALSLHLLWFAGNLSTSPGGLCNSRTLADVQGRGQYASSWPRRSSAARPIIGGHRPKSNYPRATHAKSHCNVL